MAHKSGDDGLLNKWKELRRAAQNRNNTDPLSGATLSARKQEYTIEPPKPNPHKGFSLIELMVVIAIIGVLAAVAVPAYRQYYAKSQIAAALPVIDGFFSNLKQYYSANGKFPTTISLGGTSITVVPGSGSAWTAITNVTNIANASYQISADGLGAGIGFNFGSLMISGFASGVNGQYSDIYFGLRDNGNGVISTACGQNTASDSIPFTYIPSNCTCTFIGVGWPLGSGYLNGGSC